MLLFLFLVAAKCRSSFSTVTAIFDPGVVFSSVYPLKIDDLPYTFSYHTSAFSPNYQFYIDDIYSLLTLISSFFFLLFSFPCWMDHIFLFV